MSSVIAITQVEGKVDQSAGMLDEEVKDKGYALLCVSEPVSDCKIRVIDEVRSRRLCTLNNHAQQYSVMHLLHKHPCARQAPQDSFHRCLTHCDET